MILYLMFNHILIVLLECKTEQLNCQPEHQQPMKQMFIINHSYLIKWLFEACANELSYLMSLEQL